MRDLILFMSRRVAGEESEALASQARAWIENHMDANYEWPGNYRELEECIRNILIRKEYQTAHLRKRESNQDLFFEARSGTLTAGDLLTRCCTMVYAKTGSYEETARRVELDRRTVNAKVDRELLKKLTGRRFVVNEL